MAMRLKFFWAGPARKAAAIDPLPRAVHRALNEKTRCREIIWRRIKWTEHRLLLASILL